MIRQLVLAAAVFFPLVLLGGTAHGGSALCAGLAIVASLAVGTHDRARSERPPVPLALAMLGVAVLAALQTVPLPHGVLAVLSPVAARIWPSWGPISLSPWETAGASVLWAAAAALHDATACAAYGGPGRRPGERERAQLDGRARRALAMLAVIALAVGTAASVERTFGWPLWSTHFRQPEQALGPFPNRNDLAVLAASALPLAAGLLTIAIRSAWSAARSHPEGLVSIRSSPDAARIAGWAAGSMLLATVVLASGSRSGTLGAAAGLAAFSITLRSRGGAAAKRIAEAARWAPLVLVAGVAVWSGVPRTSDLPRGMEMRIDLWRRALAIAADHPIAGVGLGAFDAALPLHPPRENLGFAAHAENDALELLAEVGAIGVLVIAVGALLWTVRTRRAAHAGGREGIAAASVLGGTTAFAVAALGTFAFPVPALLLWISALTGAGAGLSGTRPLGATSEAVAGAGRSRTRVRVFALICMAALVPVVAGRITAAVYWHSARAKVARVPVVDAQDGQGGRETRMLARATLQRAAQWDSRDPRVALELARSFEREALESPAPWRDARGPLDAAIAWQRRRLASRPTDAYARLSLASLLETSSRGAGPNAAAERSEAARLRREAVALDPGDPAVAQYEEAAR